MAAPHTTSRASAKQARPEPLRLLLLCDYDDHSAGTTVDHIKGIPAYSRHAIHEVQFRGILPKGLTLGWFDGLIIHYTLVACYDSYINPATRNRIRAFRGFKAIFVQDDYRFIDATVEAIAYMNIHAVFGLAPQAIIDEVYSPRKLPGVHRETVLAGYVPELLTTHSVPPLRDRTLDVGYRARHVAPWIGSLSQEKWIIAERFAADALRFNLRVDISCREVDRIYGDDWIDFLTRCKAVLGTESGSSVCDFTGEIQRRVEAHLKRDPGASFEELSELYFKDEDGRLIMNIMSPRCFEAAALRTLMILYEGDYSGRLLPWRHYVPLERDHSNMAEVVSVLRDLEHSQEIVDRAYDEVALEPRNSFRAMVAQFDEVVDRAFAPQMQATGGYQEAAFEAIMQAHRRRVKVRRVVYRLLIRLKGVLDRGPALLPKETARRIRLPLLNLLWGWLAWRTKRIEAAENLRASRRE